MNSEIFTGLIINAAALLILALLLDLILVERYSGYLRLKKIILGFFTGCIGVFLMMNPWIFSDGIIFDTRSVLLAISGLFFGHIPTLIAMGMTAIFRYYQGGAAAWTGISVIIASGIIGLIWRNKFREKLKDISFLNIVLMAYIVHAVMLGLMFTLPYETALAVVKAISLPVLTVYPASTAILGLILRDRLRKDYLKKRLRENEERLRLAVESAKIGFFDRNLDTQTVVRNEQWCQNIGYTKEELSNSHAEWRKRVHPDDMENNLREMQACIDGRIPNFEFEYRLLHRDGSYRWFLSRGFLYKDVNDNIRRLIGCEIEIDQQKRAEVAIKESETNFRSLFETIGDLILVAAEQGNILYANQSLVNNLGYSLEELKEMNIPDLHPPENAEEARQIIKDVLEREEEFCSLPLQAKDGTLIPVQTRAWFGKWNGQDCIFGISKDLRAEKEAEQLFESLFRNNPNIMAVSSIHDRRFMDVNNAFLDKLGYTDTEILGKTPLELKLFPETEKQMENGDRLEDQGKIDNVELKVKKKNGQILEGLFSGDIIENHGEKSLLTVMVDITERKKLDEIMKANHEELQRLLDVAEESRQALLSVAEDQQIAQEALTKLSEELIYAYDATLKGWSKALELRERETAGHSQRVVEFTMNLAKKFIFDDEELNHIQRGALLHDIGKMGIPDSILLKPGPLNEDEWTIMKQHPVYAYRLLAEIPYLQPALDIPYSHHERWDGSGYPRGLKEKEIPLPARIFAIIDVWDALSSDRPYRPAWDSESVIRYIKEQSGKQFDPAVVEEFLLLLAQNPDGIHKNNFDHS